MMKSKFFSLNAKLALAVLAVGTMFTGCYDSENGDVNKPYVAPDPEPQTLKRVKLWLLPLVWMAKLLQP